jgi:hypothetical protein
VDISDDGEAFQILAGSKVLTSSSGLPDGLFSNQNPNFGQF